MEAVNGPPVSDIDPFSVEFFENPFPVHAALRDAGPVVRLSRYGVWGVARYEQVHAVLNDWQTFCSSRGAGLTDFAKEKPGVSARLKWHPTAGRSHSAASARTLRDGRPFVGIPGVSRLFGGRWRRGSPRRRFGGYDACSSCTKASAAPSRLFSTIAPGATVSILSNTRNGRATPSCRTAKRPSG